MWHWLRLAEDYAMADILTGGRVIFGVGRGCHTREVERFGAPLLDPNANREMFGEGVELLFKAFAGEPFSHQGKYYTIPPEVPYRGYTLKEITLVPAPQRLPVECWQPIQSGSERAFDSWRKTSSRTTDWLVRGHLEAEIGRRMPWQACYTERRSRRGMNGHGA
jgi:alkanesulfonate monooxygenase SsuD/methylene tetrahydromethanopterin reductase-like flavin-dependent oxidoreductase (luciferase family)